MKTIRGKIILIDDDEFENELLNEALRKLTWDVKINFFSNAVDAIDYLKGSEEPIFIIICDMNMPGMTGLQLKKTIDSDRTLSNKSIPFIFLTTSATRAEVTEAYDYRVQGYFQKPSDIKGMAEMLDAIIKYWVLSRHPNEM